VKADVEVKEEEKQVVEAEENGEKKGSDAGR
jgi:hypothetical protein